jgi:hypothetical protein
MKTCDHSGRSRPTRGGALLKVLLVIGLVFALAAIAWVVLLPGIVAAMIHSKTGFVVKIDRLSVNPFTTNCQISGLVLQNPEGWPEPNFIELRQFRADVQPLSLMVGRFVANEVVADVAQVTLVKNQQGVLNTAAFTNGVGGNDTKKPATTQPAAPGRQSAGFLIHHLALRFDKLVYADYSRGKPYVKTYDVNLNREMTEVDSVAKLISPFTGPALGAVAAAFGGMSPKDADALTNAVDLLQDAGKKTGESLKNLFHSLDNKKP